MILSYISFFFKSSIIKLTTLNTNKQKAIRGVVANSVVYVVSMSPKYQHIVSSLSSENEKTILNNKLFTTKL